MRTISRYHRPATLNEAVDLLARDGVTSIVVGGGTVVNATGETSDTEIVDVQVVCADAIEEVDDRVIFGAMTRLQSLVDHPVVPSLLRELAHREGPNTLRNAATVGGTVASGDPDSELLAGLLVHEATVDIERREGSNTVSLVSLLSDPTALQGGIITSISVALGGTTASARTGRTPADVPIVAAVGRMTADGTLLALTGVASSPIIVTHDSINSLKPPADFRGTTDYRRTLARTLATRVLDQLGGAA
jgi:CO/xanthine dehydrogenase FAD-binding subunit